jgi:hypothetical protein
MKKQTPPILTVFLLFTLIAGTPCCYQYRVLNTNNDPSTEYREATMHSYGWGLWNKPQNLHVPDCSTSNALDEVTLSKNVGQSLLTWITFGFVSTVKVKWRCHKPCAITDSL